MSIRAHRKVRLSLWATAVSYRLRDGLSYCRVDGHVVFLDIPNDRYFELPTTLEATFSAYVDGSDSGASALDITKLVENHILTDKPIVEPHDLKPVVHTPRRSTFEQGKPDDTADWRVTLEVMVIVCWTQLRLKAGRLENVIGDTISRRDRTASSFPGASRPAVDHIMQAADAFARARLYVPIDTCCLLDTLSLVTFLARRQLPAHVVFGVARNPFAAHCWVQSGDVVLNDTVGNVSNHTRILVL